MEKEKIQESFRSFEEAAAQKKSEKYILRLYVTGMTPKSTAAINNLTKICEAHLHGRYDLQVIDVYKHPALAAGEQIVAAPTLIKKLPLPLRRFIGDMTNTDRIMVGLELQPANPEI